MKSVRERSPAILDALPPIQSADIEDNPRLNALLAAMLKNNEQLFNLYVGYDDGSFIEMDAIEGAGRETRAKLEAPEGAAFRLVRDIGVRPRPGSSHEGCFCPITLRRSGSCRAARLRSTASVPGSKMTIGGTAPG